MNNFIPILSENTLSSYVSRVYDVADLTQEEEIKLFQEYKLNGSVEAAKKLIIANLKLVVNAAYKFRKYRDITDLIQEGNIGLLIALKKFNLAKGFRFATYAIWWIKSKIQEFIISHISIVRFGKARDERKLFFNLISTIKDIETYDHDREITHEELINEIAQRLNISTEKVTRYINIIKSSGDISLSETYDDSDNEKYQIADNSLSYDNDIIKQDKTDIIMNAINQLDEREQFIINNRYMTKEPMTLEEIGKIYGVTKEAIRQKEERALEKIKRLVKIGK